MKKRSAYNQRSFSPRPLSSRRAENKARNRLIVTFLLILFIGYALISWVLPAVVGGLSFLNSHKTTPNSTPPVTESTTLAPPVLNIPYEATNTATIKVNGYTQPNTSVEIYVDKDLKSTTTTDTNGNFVSDNIPLTFGTNDISGKTVDSQGNKSLSSKPIKIYFSNQPPSLNLSSPQDNQTITGGDKTVTVSGTTDQTNGLTLTINGQQVIINSDGSFSQTIGLNDGDNTITVTVTDQAGNTTQLTRKVTYKSS